MTTIEVFPTAVTDWSDITGKPTTFPPSAHTHPENVLKAGDTMTGGLAIDAPGNSSLTLVRGAASNLLIGANGGTVQANWRWVMQLGDAVAESGSETGSNFDLRRYTNLGVYLDSPISIVRATGIPHFVNGLTTPTPTAGANDISVATTQFVTSAVATKAPIASPTFTGTMTFAQTLASSTAAIVLSTTGAGNIFMRTVGDATNAWQVSNAGNVIQLGPSYTLEGGASTTGVNRGISLLNGSIRTSATVTSATKHAIYYTTNTPNEVGNITTSGNVLTFNSLSDEAFKEFIGTYDPLSAIEIIRADPVRDFHWKGDGAYAVGWGAQTSYNVSQDLATPPAPRSPEEAAIEGAGTDPKEPGYIPWSMDQAKRTPYLWAALTWALDQIDQLNARVAALEARRVR